MSDAPKTAKPIIVGKPVLIVIDVQKGCFSEWTPSERLPLMPDNMERMRRIAGLITAARDADVPIIFFKEEHRASMIDFGRELDGTENVHCLETSPNTPIAAEELGMRPSDIAITKRRYSCFFGTELEIVLKGLKANTLIMTGGFTDVCVHYTFVDGHQHDYYCRVVEDCVSGSSQAAHDASIRAMEYLQTGATRTCAEMTGALLSRNFAPVE